MLSDSAKAWLEKQKKPNQGKYAHDIGEFVTKELAIVNETPTSRYASYIFHTKEVLLKDKEGNLYTTTKSNLSDFGTYKMYRFKVTSHGVTKANNRLHVISIVEELL